MPCDRRRDDRGIAWIAQHDLDVHVGQVATDEDEQLADVVRGDLVTPELGPRKDGGELASEVPGADDLDSPLPNGADN